LLSLNNLFLSTFSLERKGGQKFNKNPIAPLDFSEPTHMAAVIYSELFNTMARGAALVAATAGTVFFTAYFWPPDVFME
jgi:hypothetical protein